ncbi:MAG: molybdenum cofactor guanylyltransferase [Micavibrio sp.]|nr:MAG: molybdenum cofactor guanylyltransferase [Micavibrio sp.]
MDKVSIAGVVLAGGCSSRMGQDKALLDYNGRPLLDHMIDLLQKMGVADIYVSGNYEGYHCIPDSEPCNGPAEAIQGVMKELNGHDGALFVPVDMPFLTQDVLHILLAQEGGAFFKDRPLPAFIKQPCSGIIASSVHALLEELGVPSVFLPEEFESLMANINTQKEWQEAIRA